MIIYITLMFCITLFAMGLLITRYMEYKEEIARMDLLRSIGDKNEIKNYVESKKRCSDSDDYAL